MTPEQLAGEIQGILPPGTQVRTGDAQAREDAKDTESFLNFLQDFLLAFGGIALFVGAFVIANSLSITIAQRTRELATLRTLGASRRQVRFSIMVEALVMGTLASITGIFVGLGLGVGLFKLFDAVGLHAAEQRPRPAHAHGRRRAARRDHRHAARQPPAGVPGDARAADRRRPRGCRLPPGPVTRVPRTTGSIVLDGARLRRPRLRACGARAERPAS